MSDARRTRVRFIAFLVALVVALAAVGFLVLSLRQRDDARHDLAAVRTALRTERATSSTAATDLTAAHKALQALVQPLGTVGPSAAAIAKLDQQDLDAVKAALEAGLAGDLAAYNAAVDQRGVIDPEHDATVEQLREQVNTIITVLDGVRG